MCSCSSISDNTTFHFMTTGHILWKCSKITSCSVVLVWIGNAATLPPFNCNLVVLVTSEGYELFLTLNLCFQDYWRTFLTRTSSCKTCWTLCPDGRQTCPWSLWTCVQSVPEQVSHIRRMATTLTQLMALTRDTSQLGPEAPQILSTMSLSLAHTHTYCTRTHIPTHTHSDLFHNLHFGYVPLCPLQI